jgi:hypothetical protein
VLLIAVGSFASVETIPANTGDGCEKAATVFVGEREYCVANFSGTGWLLLEQAGLSPVGTREYPKAFVCRIDGYPSSTSEDCQGPPNPAVGSWNYFIWTDQQWALSAVGAASRAVECGDSDAWVFSKEKPVAPSFLPREIECD